MRRVYFIPEKIGTKFHGSFWHRLIQNEVNDELVSWDVVSTLNS